MSNKWMRIIVIALGALIVIALLIRVFFSQAVQDLVNWWNWWAGAPPPAASRDSESTPIVEMS